MRKIRKSLAVFLAAIMLATFMPLFASAEAITITRTNVIIVPPSVSPSVIQYGENLSGLTITGGECWYVDPDTGAETLVPGHFEIRTTTTKPAINEAYSLQLKFVSDDTTQYSDIATLTGTTATIKSGTWPTIKVNGLDGTLVEAPTAAAINAGDTISKATLSGGIVNDTDGNPVTGTWSYVNTGTYPTASGKYQVQFKATGYNPIKTYVDITVTSSGTSTLSEAPTVQYYLEVGDILTSAKLIGGKVVDENGTEITTGKWALVNDENIQLAKDIDCETEGTFTYKAVWLSAGFSPVFTDVSVTVFGGYTVEKPTLTSPVYYVSTKGELPVVFPEPSIPGKYSISDPDATVSTSKTTSQSVTVSFTPDNSNLKPKSWSLSFKVTPNTIWYTEPEEPVKVIVPYGFKSNSISKGSVVSWPAYLEEQGVLTFYWTAKDYDIASMEVGEIILVKGAMRKHVSGYENISSEVYIQIQPGVYDDDFGSFTITVVDKVTQECSVRYRCDIPGITGTVTLRQGETVLGTFTPDENGKIDERVYFIPKEDGKYAFTATYTPGVMDKVTIENPVLTSNEVELDIKKQIDIFVYDNTLELYNQRKATCGVETWGTVVLATELGYIETDIECWEAYDQNGNKVDLYTAEGTLSTGAKSTRISFVVPEEDSGITELHLYPIGPWSPDDSFNEEPTDNSIFGGIWSFFQKIIDWFINIIKQMISLFGLGA